MVNTPKSAEVEVEVRLIDPLLAQVLEANAKSLEAATNTVIDAQKRDILMLSAELALVRDRIEGLLFGEYMPTGDAIRRAMYPARSSVEELYEKLSREDA
jgi:hypothetical protein